MKTKLYHRYLIFWTAVRIRKDFKMYDGIRRRALAVLNPLLELFRLVFRLPHSRQFYYSVARDFNYCKFIERRHKETQFSEIILDTFLVWKKWMDSREKYTRKYWTPEARLKRAISKGDR